MHEEDSGKRAPDKNNLTRQIQHCAKDRYPRFLLTANATVGNPYWTKYTTMPTLISSGSPFEDEIGYSRAVVCNGWVFVSGEYRAKLEFSSHKSADVIGTTGFNYESMELPSTVAEQTTQTFKNIETALAKAGATIKDIVRVRYYFLSREDFKSCQPVLKEVLGSVKPAATMVLVAGLLDPEMKVEIDVTAKLPQSNA